MISYYLLYHIFDFKLYYLLYPYHSYRLSCFARVLRTGPQRAGQAFELRCEPLRGAPQLQHQAYHPFASQMGLGIDTRRRGGLLTIKMPSWQSYYLIYLFWKFNVSCEGCKAYGILAIFFPDFIKGLVAGFAFKILLMV